MCNLARGSTICFDKGLTLDAKDRSSLYAHPEPKSLTRTLADEAKATLIAQGHRVLESDLYRMHWKAVFDAQDFPERADPARLSFLAESDAAYANATQTPDVQAEQEKLKEADAVVFLFPL